ncbi:MAG: SDR family oxidoreductase [Parvibaculum sp.]|uniref:SDR family NAD(P)-dependent oxidoreductase n=1 Tax=Parvibaculum sp. TaxID=2024848 RepID=UPI003C71B44C
MPLADTRGALVTGASRNIGRAVAIALAREGYGVACFGRDRAALDETVEIIRNEGGTASVHVGDIVCEKTLATYVDEATSIHGSIDVLINNAGIMQETLVADTPPETFQHVLDVNVVSAYALSRLAYPWLRKRGGTIVNMGSMFASVGVASTSAYSASKAGLEGLTRALAAEWARDRIRVLIVAPGYVRTEISAAVLQDPAMEKRLLSRIPLRRVAEPEEVGKFVAFLASDQASFATGEVYRLDGGQRMSI